MDPPDFDADPDPMDPGFQRRIPETDPDKKFVYMTMAFFHFLYCKD